MRFPTEDELQALRRSVIRAVALCDELRRDGGSKVWGVEAEGDAVRALWNRVTAGEPNALEELRTAAKVAPLAFVRPSGDALRSGRWASAHGFASAADVTRALPALLAAVEGTGEDEAGRLRIVRGSDRSAITLEVRKPRPLRAPEGAVVLDATGSLELEALRAANPGRPVRLFALDVAEAAGAEVRRVLIRTPSTSIRRTVSCGDLTPKGAATLRRSLELVHELARETFETERPTLAILTRKAVAERIEHALGADIETLRAALDLFDLTPGRVGYYGRDERGSNRFQDADVLLLWGDPVGNLGALQADARALGIDPDEHVRSTTAANLAQAEGRARAVRGGRRLIVHAGLDEPPGWRGRCEVRELPKGRPGSEERDAVEAAALEHLAKAGWVAAWAIAAERVLVTPPSTFTAETPSRPQEGRSVADRRVREWVAAAARDAGAIEVRVPIRGGGKVWALPTSDRRTLVDAVRRAWAERETGRQRELAEALEDPQPALPPPGKSGLEASQAGLKQRGAGEGLPGAAQPVPGAVVHFPSRGPAPTPGSGGSSLLPRFARRCRRSTCDRAALVGRDVGPQGRRRPPVTASDDPPPRPSSWSAATRPGTGSASSPKRAFGRSSGMSGLRAAPGKRTRTHLTANPHGRSHARILREFVRKAPPWVPFIDEHGEAWVWASSTFRDNPHVDGEAYRRKLLASTGGDHEPARAWVEGDWNTLGGSMFAPPFDPRIHVLPQAPPPIRGRYGLTIGADWGTASPSTALLIGRLRQPVAFSTARGRPHGVPLRQQRADALGAVF